MLGLLSEVGGIEENRVIEVVKKGVIKKLIIAWAIGTEVGGIEENRVIEVVKKGVIKKLIIAWVIGTCAKMFVTEVQFGHAGSLTNSELETADMKNRAMHAAGFIVPETFEELPDMLEETYRRLVAEGAIRLKAEHDLHDPDGLQELMYAGMHITDVFKENIGLGGVVSLLWFKRRLPEYATKFVGMVLMHMADHGPAVSGAMNTIVATRAGKDLISSLASALLTIGSRFGGALDEAASMFSSVPCTKILRSSTHIGSIR
ncbi:citrate synthase [Neolentinus lepideus HHB14362 ss-1]|uniref:Citrate synthase n=1 Tax=Neolentinus lepideus HHB14362 ss-1 TaxID=1314782 RepID=A0A165VAD9_9AGAM|nr:citrate synthase [Neolentinus lepideus HHB14362 ss-1]